jgi:large subunit ribosomal protein L4
MAEAKTKHYRTALDKLEAKKSALLVEASKQLDEKLYLGSRNLQNVELVLSSEVHPYDLLKYEHTVISKAALEALQETLKKAVSKRTHAAKDEAPKEAAPKKVVRKKKEAV